ncbi:MAG: hypothetical protein IJ677_05460, partial [Alphaproteobacteria bacterium]|nr:hypothetical protein [Alphaproteobacteria bacterium]
MYNNFNKNDGQETVRQTLERVMRAKERQEAQKKAMEYASRVKLSSNNNLDNEKIMADRNLSSVQKIGRMTWNNFTEFNPLKRIGETLGTLHSAKQEMDQMRQDGYDNYA